MLRAYGGTLPRAHPTACIDQNAHVIGDVEVGEAGGVRLNVVPRGDVHWIPMYAGRDVHARLDDMQA